MILINGLFSTKSERIFTELKSNRRRQVKNNHKFWLQLKGIKNAQEQHFYMF